MIGSSGNRAAMRRCSGNRHAEEGRAEQHTEHRHRERAQRGAAGRRQDPRDGAERDGHEVQRHLMPLRPGRDPLHDSGLSGRGPATRTGRLHRN
ncbi:MAG: hypothetical protein JST33_04030 [Actinobacteria bacterium]|nr:hypothetical protein [Actinomycetota bacterium]